MHTPQVWHRAEELPASARMLTLLALYYNYAGGGGGDGGAFALRHFSKAHALARLLLARRAASLRYGPADARYGLPVGGYEARAFSSPLAELTTRCTGAPSHWCAPAPGLYYTAPCNPLQPLTVRSQPLRYASAAEAYRAFAELGAVWVAVGRGAARRDVVAHGEELLAVAPLLYRDLHTSLNRTATPAAAAGGHCWPAAADQPTGSPSPTFRSHAAMLWSGALSSTQLEDIYAAGTDAAACGARTLALGSPAEAGAVLTTASPFGLASQLVRNGACPRWPQRPSFSASFPEGPGHTLLPRSAAHRLSGASAGAVLPARKRSQGERSPPARL